MCSVVCSIILQRILGLFLLKNFTDSLLFSQQSSRYMKVHWNPVVTGGLFLSEALCTSTSTWNCFTLFPYICLRKSCDLLFTQTATTAEPHRIFQTVYTAHKIILLYNNPVDTLWKKTLTSCLGS